LFELSDLEQYTPKVQFKNLDVQQVDWNQAQTEFVFTVENPNPIDVNLASLTYDLDLGGMDFFSGDNPDGMSLKAEGKSQLRIPATVVFADLFELHSSYQAADTMPFSLAGDIGFNTPIGEIKIPYKEQGDFPVLRRPQFEFKALRVTDLAVLQNRASLALDLGVTNEQASNLGFGDFEYDLFLKGKNVASGNIKQLTNVEGGKNQTVTVPVDIDLLQAGEAIVKLIKDRSQIKVRLKAGMSVDTPFGALPLDLDRSQKLKLQ
jgi:LEA14-like dessication related protein